MVLENYVTFMEGVPRVLHFVDHSIVDREITDPLTGLKKQMTVLALTVDQVDGRNQNAVLSVTSENLASQLAGYLNNKSYKGYTFTITRRGAGFSTRYTVVATPL